MCVRVCVTIRLGVPMHSYSLSHVTDRTKAVIDGNELGTTQMNLTIKRRFGTSGIGIVFHDGGAYYERSKCFWRPFRRMGKLFLFLAILIIITKTNCVY